jgi:glycosyltransferase involved in cell wall biosynthesis
MVATKEGVATHADGSACRGDNCSDGRAAVNDVVGQPRAEQTVAEPTGPVVLQVLPELDEGGAERGTCDLARYMIGEGWRAVVASAGGGGESELVEAGARSVRLPLHAKNPFTIRANIRRLQRVIREHRVQLVHARSRAPAWSAYYAARRCKVPFVTTFHGVYADGDGFFKRRYNAIMARGERVIAISEYVAQHIRERYQVPPERLRLIPRGVDTQQFDPAAVSEERRAALAERWRLTPGTRVLMLPGRLTRRKGHTLLLRAIERMRRRNFVCLLVGDVEGGSTYAGEVEGLIGAMDLRDVVRMVGTCDDMPAALLLADAVVVPSTLAPEPFGRVAVEAQAMGKPVVVTDIGGLGETLMPAATGWLVPPDDVDELARALALAMAMPDGARARLATRARRFVLRNFTLEQMGRSTLAVYRELLEGAPPDTDLEGIGEVAA